MNSYRVGIAGFGAIGQSVAQSLNAGLPGLSLAAVAVRDPQAPPAFDWREPPRFSTRRPARALRRGGGVRAGRRVPRAGRARAAPARSWWC